MTINNHHWWVPTIANWYWHLQASWARIIHENHPRLVVSAGKEVAWLAVFGPISGGVLARQVPHIGNPTAKYLGNEPLVEELLSGSPSGEMSLLGAPGGCGGISWNWQWLNISRDYGTFIVKIRVIFEIATSPFEPWPSMTSVSVGCIKYLGQKLVEGRGSPLIQGL